MTLLQQSIALLDQCHAVEKGAHHFLCRGYEAFDARMEMAARLRAESRTLAALHHYETTRVAA